MSTFAIVALSIWAGMNGYAFWRLGTLTALAKVPWWSMWTLMAALVVSFPVSRWLRHAWPRTSEVLEVVSVNWLGVLLLLCVCFLVVDVVTLGGFFWRGWVLKLRGAALVAAVVLSGVAAVLGTRDPVVRTADVVLPGLPRARDGLRLLFISDLHLGTQINRAWLQRLVLQMRGLKPDLIAVGGDLVDHDVEKVKPLLPELEQWQAPLGVWAVLGNHEAYSGSQECVDLLRAAGFRVLLDASAEVAPGLRLAGVQDLGVRRRSGQERAAVREALKDVAVTRGHEGVVFLSHTPEMMDEASALGAGLMLCGHTHGGQLWPFNYAVAARYPTIAGRYPFGDMTLIVSRGAGTWGPRMRLWKPGEIWLITLRAK